jgi:rhamnogalacturonyl hydrolase YesR
MLALGVVFSVAACGPDGSSAADREFGDAPTTPSNSVDGTIGAFAGAPAETTVEDSTDVASGGGEPNEGGQREGTSAVSVSSSLADDSLADDSLADDSLADDSLADDSGFDGAIVTDESSASSAADDSPEAAEAEGAETQDAFAPDEPSVQDQDTPSGDNETADTQDLSDLDIGTDVADQAPASDAETESETAVDNPLAHLTASAQEVGLLLTNRFDRRSLDFSSVSDLPGDGYKSACEWYGALAVASLTDEQDLLNSLVFKFDPLKTNFVGAMTGGEAHVDRYIFGMVPLEIYLQTGDDGYLPLGTEAADTQQITNQTRNAIDDMFMMTGLQLEAYRATGDAKYIDFMASTMVDYLEAQQDNGLFFHNVTEARTHWGRGNGWFAAGMAEIMRDLPTDSEFYPAIEDGYKRMMEGLLPYQSSNGLWYQVLDMPDDPNNWEESSGSAMFTYAMVAGVRRGVLDTETYVPVIEAAWQGLQSKINVDGDVSDICVGTWYQASPRAYMGLSRLTGDGHGQAPVLWTAAELLR